MRNKIRGMTLIELVVVVAIIALLATIAIPSYRQFLLRSHRAEAKSALLNLAAAQEKFYLQSNTYADNDDLDDAPPAGLGLTATTVNGHFTVVITAANDDSFTATATAAGGQAQDTHCATFTINQAGARTATSADCW
jgi:type IV pilus assembly protein PilE